MKLDLRINDTGILFKKDHVPKHVVGDIRLRRNILHAQLPMHGIQARESYMYRKGDSAVLKKLDGSSPPLALTNTEADRKPIFIRKNGLQEMMRIEERKHSHSRFIHPGTRFQLLSSRGIWVACCSHNSACEYESHNPCGRAHTLDLVSAMPFRIWGYEKVFRSMREIQVVHETNGGRSGFMAFWLSENHSATTKEVAADIGSAPKRKGQHTVVQGREDDVPGCLVDV
ncbi:hypothetical protein ARMGADRAFT_1028415 [Armillaria gallica]|uniref:Uncharacterized protein n=1 Tax=Armillaria gallica TaxID=47427 RepID=A0A2H3E4G8_ARMGA|nr:hypothetical protein ARMGADRAFT_1028415 [Armillaria gallica]